MSFLSDATYRDFLEQRIRTLDDVVAREYARNRFSFWCRQYRLIERAAELFTSEKERPKVLYLRNDDDLGFLRSLFGRCKFDSPLFRGFLVSDELRSHVKPEWFSPFPLWQVSDWRDREDTAVLSLSDEHPLRENGRDRGNDYANCIASLPQLEDVTEIRRRFAGRRIVLCIDYRQTQTLAALSDEIRRNSRFATILLVDVKQGHCEHEFDAVIEQPYCYLWPLVFETLAPDLFHVNVGWGTQGLALAPFLPQEAIIDFYDVLTLVRDDVLDGHHAEPLALTRASERTLFSRFRRFIHRCSEDTSRALLDMYPDRSIVSVTEYLREPVCEPRPVSRDGILRLVYGGLLVREGAGPDDPHYKNFVQMAKFYCRENCHLYLYPSPYLYGFSRPRGIEELARSLGFENVHACAPLAENDFVREIARYDFGLCVPTPEETRPTSYGYILPGKIIAYLRAGLPIVVPEDQTFVADLVREHGIGVVYGYGDADRMADLLHAQDVDQLKKNVVRFRERFRIDRGARKVIDLYDDALGGRQAGDARPADRASCDPCVDKAFPSWSSLLEKLDRCGFLSAAEYDSLLYQEIGKTLSGETLRYATDKFRIWSGAYRGFRCVSRLTELVAALKKTSYWLYLDDPASLPLLVSLLHALNEMDLPGPDGFVAGQGLEQLRSQLTSRPVVDACDAVPAGHIVISVSGKPIPESRHKVVLNDYLERFIDRSRLSVVTGIRRQLADRQVVLYVSYRMVQTLPTLSSQIRRSSNLATVLLVDALPDSSRRDFDGVLEEPYRYLWPLVLRCLPADQYHINVGWGTQGVPFMPFIPDASKTVVDFYDVTTLIPDECMATESEPLALTRASEEYLWRHFHRFVHRCSDAITERLREKYPQRAIASIVEYVREPVFSEPPAKKGDLNLAYGGLIIQDASKTDSVYYRRFQSMVRCFAKDNLHLFIYPSPYMYGFGKPKAVEQLIRIQGLTNVHPCEALEEEEWVRAISRHDYGVCIPSDTQPSVYPYILPFKVIAYLRAGLPIVVPEDQTFVADLVREHEIGVIYTYDDVDRMAELLNAQDLNRLKANVVQFREQFRVEKAAEKVLRLYDGALKSGGLSLQAARSAVRRRKRVSGPARLPVSTRPPQTETAASSWPQLMEKLERTGFLGAREYQNALDREISRTLSDKERQYVSGKLQNWLGMYRNWRCLSRLLELVAETGGTPYSLYLDEPAQIDLLASFLDALSEAGLARPAGFVVADGLEEQKGRLSPHPVSCVRDGVSEGHVVIGFSGAEFPGCCRDVRLNDYLDRFIDSRRFQGVRDVVRSLKGLPAVLYPLYREIHTIPMMAQCLRQKDAEIRCVSLSPGQLLDAHFDAGLTEPFLYLWPLILRMVDPAMVHLNVGWGVQALPLSPFIPDRERTVVDFYEVLSFLPDSYFDKTHSNAEQVRLGEEHFFRNYGHIMHLCSEEISGRLTQKYDYRGSLVSVTEYLQRPTYNKPPRDDGEIRLVYGGCMLASTNPEDLYYRAFTKVVPYFTRGNLQLYVYNSPYVHGIVENEGLKEVIRRLGLTQIHACTPKKLDDFVREISDYDFGVTLLRPKDMNAVEYDYFMATKVLTYLRAGLPVVIDADNHYMAGLVERYNLGVVLQEHDLENLPEILNSLDLRSLKQNVVEARERFSIDKGGDKVLKLYHEILRKSDARSQCVVPSMKTSRSELPISSLPLQTSKDSIFQQMIDVMARRENRLYYRDQSARTMSSLASLAEQLDPTVIVELGTLGGLSLRTWIGSTTKARIYAVDLSFQTLRETMGFLPADLSRVTLLEQDILKTDFARLWSAQDRVIFFVDAHDLPNVPIMKHVLETALPSLPDGSLVVVDDLWFSEDRLTHDNARAFLEGRVCNEIDELQCFHGHYAPYHEGGSFLGFAEVIPLLEFANRHGIPLVHDRGGKHVFFVWKRAYLSQDFGRCEGDYGSSMHNPLESVPGAARNAETMRAIADRYRQRDIRGAAECLSQALAQDPRDEGLSYGLAVCLARVGMLSQARDVLAGNLTDASHPRYRRLYDDLVQRVGASEAPAAAPAPPSSRGTGLTLFTMPKAFVGHTATIQKNAVRSWARLDPKPEIILFGDEPGIKEMAEEVGARHVPDVARNEFGTPLVDKLFHAGQDGARHDTVAYVNADMILMQDFLAGVQKVQASLPNFLLIGRRWDLDVLDQIDFGQAGWRESLLQELNERAILHAECGLDYFVFHRGLWPQIPPFAIGRTAWDNWLVIDPRRRGVPVVDGTESITAVHQDHDYQHAGGRDEAWKGREAVRNQTLAGSLDESAYTTHAPWVLRKDGQLVQMPPRPPEVGTPIYRSRRIGWLVKQAEWLKARGKADLAACKWEETLTLLDKMMASRLQGYALASQLDDVLVTRCYMAACVSLAGCCAELGRREQAVASYSRFLDAPWIKIPQAQRDEMTRVRDQLLGELSHAGEPCRRQEDESCSPGPDKRIALIVSIPDRSEGLRNVLQDIESQVDEIRILLNEFDSAPQDLYACRKVTTIETSRTGELYASGVWTLLKPEDDGYVFVLDDDLRYPADYVAKMIAGIERRHRRAVMVVHGVDYCEPFADCTRDRIVYRFEAHRSRDGEVDVGGVGTLAFHTSTIRPQVKDSPNPNFRDLWFAVLAAKMKVPIVCIAREAHWVRSQDTQGKQLWYLFGTQEWKDRRNEVFRRDLLPLLDVRTPGRRRKRDLTVFSFTNGRSTFEHSIRSLMNSSDLKEQITVLPNMRFLDAAARCVETCETPYLLKLDDDFILHPKALAYMRDRVLAYPRPEELGIYYCHLWEDWTSRVRESVKIYNVEALRKIGGFQPDHWGKVDRTTLARLEQAGFKIVADPSVVALHACGTWEEQLEYERLWSEAAGTSYQKPTHEAMKKYCGTKSLDEQYGMRRGFLESVNRQLDTPFHKFLADGTVAAPPEPSAGTPVVSVPIRDDGLTIFAMPKAFTGHTGIIQRNAIRSWKQLDPAPEILLFGNEPGIREMAEEVGARHIPDVDRNEFGTPRVDKLFQAAQDLAGYGTLAYVNADMILMNDFVQGAATVRERLANFLLIGQRWDLPILDEIDFGDPQWCESLRRRMQKHAMLHAECGLDYFVFPKGLWPHIPPFAIGRTAWDNWLVMDPRKRGVAVVDGTEYITAVHQDHDYGHVAGGRREAWNGQEAARNQSLAGPTDYQGLTSGATWLLRADGGLVETELRRPQYITAAYRNQRSAWLLQGARDLLNAGATELAACKCEEVVTCLNGWLELKRSGHLPAEPGDSKEIGVRFVVSHTLLAQCYRQMGRHNQVVATYTSLLENPSIEIPAAQRQEIAKIRDRIVRQVMSGTAVVDPLRRQPVEGTGPQGRCHQVREASAEGRRPKVTVVTACRNGERFLRECVDSIRGQTMPDWELLLIDDGSTDGSRRMIEEFAGQDPRIRPYYFPDNRGPYVRRNFAIRRAASDFIVIQDCDDIMSPVKLETLYSTIRQDDRLAVVGSLHRTFVEEFRGTEHTESYELPLDHETIVSSCAAWRAVISHGLAIIRRSLFDTIGPYDENPFASDAFWLAKLAMYSQTGAPVRMINVPQYLTFIRIHADSQTQLLPVFDPRSRRARYRHYCEHRLGQIREKWQRRPDIDIAAELRNCCCSDFLMRFRDEIVEWESQPLSADFVNELLSGAVSAFRDGAYVSTVAILNGLGVMRPDIARQVAGFDLVKGMAFCALGLSERGLRPLEQEAKNHASRAARQFLYDVREQGPSMDIRLWNARHLPDLALRLEGEGQEQVRVATV
jgi:GT2 family glycosyltransferase/predicted O-methyltransferase YrrM